MNINNPLPYSFENRIVYQSRQSRKLDLSYKTDLGFWNGFGKEKTQSCYQYYILGHYGGKKKVFLQLNYQGTVFLRYKSFFFPKNPRKI